MSILFRQLWKHFFNPASGHTAHERQVGTYLGRNFDKRQRKKKKNDLEWKDDIQVEKDYKQ